MHSIGRSAPLIFALSGLDIALWDIAAKACKTPIHTMLGSNGARRTIRSYGGVLRFDAPDHVLKVCSNFLALGYRAV